MIEYPINGMKNGITKLVQSAIIPINKKPHPPTGVIINNEEALFVRFPTPTKASENIVGNIIASKK